MSKLIDLTGQRFGNLVVIQRGEDGMCGKQKQVQWDCKCDCGGTKTIKAVYLRNGTSKSCGCDREHWSKKYDYIDAEEKDNHSGPPRKDLVGQICGDFTIIEEVGSKVYKKGVIRHWLAKCDCGNKKIMPQDQRNSPRMNLCTACRKSLGDKKHTNKTKDWTGLTQGKLTVLHEISPYISPGGQKHKKYLCQCDCGTKKEIRASLLAQGTQSCGCLSAEKIKVIMSELCFEDLTGQKFNHLTVIERAKHLEKTNGSDAKWRCLCDCGKYSDGVLSTSLKNGGTKTCGTCSYNKKLYENMKYKLPADIKIISKTEAKQKGLKRYYTGKLCNNGHDSEYDMTDRCLMCKYEYWNNNTKWWGPWRRALQAGAIPALTQEQQEINKKTIAKIYRFAKKHPDYHVDHIRPLAKGGVHAFWNLQLLCAKENLKKNDKVDYDVCDSKLIDISHLFPDGSWWKRKSKKLPKKVFEQNLVKAEEAKQKKMKRKTK